MENVTKLISTNESAAGMDDVSESLDIITAILDATSFIAEVTAADIGYEIADRTMPELLEIGRKTAVTLKRRVEEAL